MKPIDPFHNLKTSVSLPRLSYRRLLAAQKIFARNRIYYSEQEIYRRLFKYFLRNWRGQGRKTNGLRRYNAEGKCFEVRPLYINQVLYAALWQRALHSGESVSRMLDVAIRVYLPRLLESLIGQPDARGVFSGNASYWAARYAFRNRQYADFFINYTCRTGRNDLERLEYTQTMEIIPKSNLSVMEIYDLVLSAA